MGHNQRISGTCVNNFGHIKPCRDLVTRVNFRPAYVNRDRLPLQMLYAMLLDEHPEVVRTYDSTLVKRYLAGVIKRALSVGDEMEPSSVENLSRFATHTVNLLSQINTMNGDVDPITVLAERYMQPRLRPAEAQAIIRQSISLLDKDPTVLNILENLETLVDDSIPQVRLWSYDEESQKPIDTVMLRRGQLKKHPWEQLKENIEQSIQLFRGGNKDFANLVANLGLDDDTLDTRERDGVTTVNRRGRKARNVIKKNTRDRDSGYAGGSSTTGNLSTGSRSGKGRSTITGRTSPRPSTSSGGGKYMPPRVASRTPPSRRTGKSVTNDDPEPSWIARAETFHL